MENVVKRKPGDGRAYIYEGREIALRKTTPEEARSARRTVSEYARDAKEALVFLETLGLES